MRRLQFPKTSEGASQEVEINVMLIINHFSVGTMYSEKRRQGKSL